MYINTVKNYLLTMVIFGFVASNLVFASNTDPDDLTGVYEGDLICIIDRTSKGDLSQEAYVAEAVVDHDLTTGVIKVSYFGLEWEGTMNARRDNNASGGIRQCPSEANQREVIVLRPHYREDGGITIHHTSSLFGASVVVGADQIAGTCFGTFVRFSTDLGDRPIPPGCDTGDNDEQRCIKQKTKSCVKENSDKCKYLHGYKKRLCINKLKHKCFKKAVKQCKK